jgi:hypothetical protein
VGSDEAWSDEVGSDEVGSDEVGPVTSLNSWFLLVPRSPGSYHRISATISGFKRNNR